MTVIARVAVGALLLVVPPFGGKPPWGLEKPVRIVGKVHHGELFEKAIGAGLLLRLAPYDDAGWRIEVGVQEPGASTDLARCVNPPFHGITRMDIEGRHFRTDDNTAARASDEFLTPGVGGKRWFDFVLSQKDSDTECKNLDGMLYIYDEKNPESIRAQSEWGSHISGRGWLKITGMELGNLLPGQQARIESMSFEAEVALHGALERWKLPATYVVPEGFTGWVTVYHRQKGAAALTQSGDHYILRLDRSGVVRTSSELRSDRHGARFVSTNGRSISTQAASSRIRGWEAGVRDCAPYQGFFIGTREQFERSSEKPGWNIPMGDCSKILPSRAEPQ
jgi:hypothetical protein